MSDPQTLRDRFDREGYVLFRQFLSGQDLQQFQEMLQRFIRDVVPGLPATDAFYVDRSRPETLKQIHRMEKDREIGEFIRQPRWKEIAEGLLGVEVLPPMGAEWFNKPPASQHETPPHQDNYYFCLKPPAVLTMWIALDHVDEENGCLRYIPGSHLEGLRKHELTSTIGFSQGIRTLSDEDRQREVAIRAEPGDMLVHHGNTIHRADANRSSSRHRRSFGIVFQGVHCERDADAFEQYQASLRQQHASQPVLS